MIQTSSETELLFAIRLFEPENFKVNEQYITDLLKLMPKPLNLYLNIKGFGWKASARLDVFPHDACFVMSVLRNSYIRFCLQEFETRQPKYAVKLYELGEQLKKTGKTITGLDRKYVLKYLEGKRTLEGLLGIITLMELRGEKSCR